MKIFLSILSFLALAGLTLGLLAAKAENKPYVPLGQEEEAAELIQKAKDRYALAQDSERLKKLPKAVCEKPTHRFGIMNPLTVATHTFFVKNEGHAPLVIQGGASSCKCTLSDLKEQVIPPGEQHPITLTWNSGHANREFAQTAIVRCVNDPLNEEIRLTVKGAVRAVLATTPDELDFGRLAPDEESEMQFVVYSQLWEEMEIDRIESSLEFIRGEESTEEYDRMVARGDELENATTAKVIKLRFNGNAASTALAGRLRIYVHPPVNWNPDSIFADETENTDSRASTSEGTSEPVADAEQEIDAISYPTEEDGTVLVELPVFGRVVRRLSIYGPAMDSMSKSLNLGKVTPKQTKGSTWHLLGKIRGAKRPTKISVETTGIPGLTAQVVTNEGNSKEGSFKITLALTERLEPAIYNREQAGKLKIVAEGMPDGENALEFAVNLSVVKS